MQRSVWLALAAIATIVAVLAFYVSVPMATSADHRAMRLSTHPVRLIATTRSGEHAFSIEVADDASERANGLMYRETMPDDHGMLFAFEQTQSVSFWMHNTPMALDLIFIGQDGRVRDILPGEPFSRETLAAREPVRYVLEVKQGIAARIELQPGDRVRHPVIDQANGPAEIPGDGKGPTEG